MDMPDDDDDGPDAQAIALAGGAAMVHLPGEWPLIGNNYFGALFDVSWLAGARLAVTLSAFHDPEAVRDKDLAPFLTEGVFSDLKELELRYDDAGNVDYEEILRRADGHRTPDRERAPKVREAFSLWRRIGVAPPDIVRRLDFQLRFPEQLEDSEDAQSVRRFLNRAIPLAEFSPHPVDSDRVASFAGLRRVSLWNAIHFLIPADWPEAVRHKPEENGPYKFDDPDPSSRWTLWVDYTIFGEPGDGRAELSPEQFAQEVSEHMIQSGDYEEVWVDPLPDRPDEAAIKTLYSSVEDGEPLRQITWSKIVHTQDRTVSASFRWVVIKSVLDEGEIRALDGLLELGILNAVITDPDADPLLHGGPGEGSNGGA